MIMAPRLRMFVLTAHIAASVSSLGAVASFLVLALVGLTSQNDMTVRGAYLAMEPLACSVILPLVLAALLSGIIQSLGTPWGLFRHYWVFVKFLFSLFIAIVLVLQMELVSYVADVAKSTTLASADLRTARLSLVIHASGGLLLLLVPTILSVYKPRGLTPYGARRAAVRP